MSKLRRITKVHERANGWSDWIMPRRRGYIMVCCDCGLAHRMDFRVVEERAQFRAQRAPRYTSAARKRKHHQTEPWQEALDYWKGYR